MPVQRKRPLAKFEIYVEYGMSVQTLPPFLRGRCFTARLRIGGSLPAMSASRRCPTRVVVWTGSGVLAERGIHARERR